MTSKDDVGSWEAVASFVETFPGDGADGACDVTVSIGEAREGEWYIRTSDDAGGSDDCDDTGYASREDAEAAACEYARECDEGEDGEDAEEHLDRKIEERAGEPDDAGEWACYWSTVLDGESRVEDRYATREQAEAAVEIANKRLHEANTGHLLCGYEVRALTDGGEWVAIDEDGQAQS